MRILQARYGRWALTIKQARGIVEFLMRIHVLAFMASTFSLAKKESMYPLYLAPPCPEKMDCPEDDPIDATLTARGNFDLTGSYIAVNLGDGCHPRSGDLPKEQWLGFLSCNVGCSEDEQYSVLHKLGMDGIVVHSAADCTRPSPRLVGIPNFSVDETITVSQGWAARLDRPASDMNWLALRLVLGFMAAIGILTSLTLWWLKPWRRHPRPRIYASPNDFNPKSMLSQHSLDVFPTLSYSPADRRKTTATCTAKRTINPILPDRKSVPVNRPPTARKRRESDPIEVQEPEPECEPPEEGVETVEEVGYFCDTLCAICLSDYEAGDRLRVLTCRHAFHADCIDPWLLSPTAHSVCPTCKSDLSAPLGLPALPLPPAAGEGPIVRFEEILGIAMPVLIYPDDPEFQAIQRRLNSQ